MDFAKHRQIMVDSQVRVNDVTAPAIVKAFLAVPREMFLPKSLQSSAYAEYPLPVSDDRAMWTPRDLGKMLHAMAPTPSDIALVIGAGAGYSAAVLGQTVETVLALDDDDEMVDKMADRFAKISMGQAVAISGDLANGLPDQGPFEVIFVAGMVETVPQKWLDQLADGGRLGVVVRAGTGKRLGQARIYVRTGETVSYREVFECCPPVLSGFEQAAAFTF